MLNPVAYGRRLFAGAVLTRTLGDEKTAPVTMAALEKAAAGQALDGIERDAVKTLVRRIYEIAEPS